MTTYKPATKSDGSPILTVEDMRLEGGVFYVLVGNAYWECQPGLTLMPADSGGPYTGYNGNFGTIVCALLTSGCPVFRASDPLKELIEALAPLMDVYRRYGSGIGANAVVAYDSYISSVEKENTNG